MEAGYLLWRLQRGEKLSLPQSRPMQSVGAHCHELRINDQHRTWRIMYRLDADAILVLEVFEKKSSKTPKHVIEVCRYRQRLYDNETR